MEWTVEVKKKVQKQVEKLPKNVKKTLATLLKEIKTYGPYRIGWPNYGPLSKNRYNCHLKKGRPTYVAVWEIKDKETGGGILCWNTRKSPVQSLNSQVLLKTGTRQ